MHHVVATAIEAICLERDDQKYLVAFDAVSALVKELGEQQLAERLFDQIPRTIPFELVAELFELLAWQTIDNGAAIHRTVESWLLAGSDNRRLLVALPLGAYPFVNQSEMETVLSELSAKNARVAQRCTELILSRRSNGRAASKGEEHELQRSTGAVRNLPLVLHEGTHSHVAEAVQKELEPLGVQLTVDVVGEHPNSSYGPIQSDRLLFSPDRRFGEHRQTWMTGPNITQDADQLCCALCGSAESLTAEIEQAAPCPSCKQGRLALVSQWIT